jgi:drug/metabolite transporter (DMT)-like permease
MPVFAALLAVAFLGERLYAYHGVGMSLVATGLFLSSTAGGRRQ